MIEAIDALTPWLAALPESATALSFQRSDAIRLLIARGLREYQREAKAQAPKT